MKYYFLDCFSCESSFSVKAKNGNSEPTFESVVEKDRVSSFWDILELSFYLLDPQF